MRNLYNCFATQQTFIKTFCQNTCTCSEIAVKTYFHFSHYKSVETLSCHSNESTWDKYIANVMNISAKFQLHAPYGFRFFNIVSQIYPFDCQIQQFGQNSYVW